MYSGVLCTKCHFFNVQLKLYELLVAPTENQCLLLQSFSRATCKTRPWQSKNITRLAQGFPAATRELGFVAETILIKNATIYDGNTNKPYEGNVLIDGKIIKKWWENDWNMIGK